MPSYPPVTCCLATRLPVPTFGSNFEAASSSGNHALLDSGFPSAARPLRSDPTSHASSAHSPPPLCPAPTPRDLPWRQRTSSLPIPRRPLSGVPLHHPAPPSLRAAWSQRGIGAAKACALHAGDDLKEQGNDAAPPPIARLHRLFPSHATRDVWIKLVDGHCRVQAQVKGS